MRIFVDTNVWLDFLLERQPHYLPSALFLSKAKRLGIDILMSTNSVVTANYICCERAKMPLENWWLKMEQMRKFVTVCAIEPSDVNRAISERWLDFEDGVQYFAARREGCDLIVTRNAKDFTLSEIPVKTPEEALQD